MAFIKRTAKLALFGVVLCAPVAFLSVHARPPLVVDGDFEADRTGKQLRRNEKGQGWYESRNKPGRPGKKLLKLSKKNIGGNATHKAMIKGDPCCNTYLSQDFPAPIEDRLSLQWDIYVKSILPPYNRSAFQMIGNASVKGRGPNGTGAERFVFLAFQNSSQEGRMDLFAFEGTGASWDERRVLVSGLLLRRWYTIRVDVDVKEGTYLVSVQGVTEKPIEVKAFRWKGKFPKKLTHVSFASWNDGPGTFYIDNVREP